MYSPSNFANVNKPLDIDRGEQLVLFFLAQLHYLLWKQVFGGHSFKWIRAKQAFICILETSYWILVSFNTGNSRPENMCT